MITFSCKFFFSEAPQNELTSNVKKTIYSDWLKSGDVEMNMDL